MLNFGENCKKCLCAKCSFWKHCGILGGNTQEQCEQDCMGEDRPATICIDFEKENKMSVDELMELLSKVPKDNIILADIGQEESAEITDVLIGTGTLKGFSFLKIEPYEE